LYPKSRRLKAVLISEEVLIQCFLTQGDGDWTNKLICPELPDDVRVHSVYYDNMYMSFRIILEHESFDEVPEHMHVPVLDLKFQAVKMLRYRSFDMPHFHHPDTQTQSIQRNEDGTIKEHICTLVTWYDSEEEQMKRYGIIGWDEKNIAIWEEGRGPKDGTIVVRGPEYKQHNFRTLLQGTWTEVGNEFFKREDLERVAKQMQDGTIKKTSEAFYEAANNASYKSDVLKKYLGVNIATKARSEGKPPIEDPFMKIWREKENE
jgi:hypothetical protein